LNLAAGIVSNRAQDITTFDLSDNGFGFDVGAESFYDSIYESKTRNTNQATYNPISSVSEFPNATSALIGRNIELRNLFGYGSFLHGNIPVSLRIGRHTLIWGESLFFPDNGIAYGMAPLDGVEATTEPNAEVKDLFLPVSMASISAQPTDTLLLEGAIELMQRYPSYRIDVYPTRRSHALPQYVYDNTALNVTRAQISADGLGVTGAYGGIPFPIPASGVEVMWNHLTAYEGESLKALNGNYVTPNGGERFLSTLGQLTSNSPYYFRDGSPETFNGIYNEPAQHGAGAHLLAGRGGLAARHPAADRL
jgi:hypothetical protein